MDVFETCAGHVRRADPDRYFSALFAPPDKRPFLFALYAFNHEIARVAETVREPMLGAIRLEWWRETVEGAARGAPRDHDVARALAAVFSARALPLDLFEAVIAARAFDSSAGTFADFTALESYIDATSGNLMRLAAKILGVEIDVRDAGLAYGLAGLMRATPFHAARHKLYLPMDLLEAVQLSPEDIFAGRETEKLQAVIAQLALRARDFHARARRMPRRRDALAAILPAALVPLYLRRLRYEVPIHRKQMALLAAAMRGRL